MSDKEMLELDGIVAMIVEWINKIKEFFASLSAKA